MRRILGFGFLGVLALGALVILAFVLWLRSWCWGEDPTLDRMTRAVVNNPVRVSAKDESREPPSRSIARSQAEPAANVGEFEAGRRLETVREKGRQKGTFKSFLHLVNTPIDRLEICRTSCDGWVEGLRRFESYQKGQFTPNEGLLDDPAFQLAQAVNQAAFGVSVREALVHMNEIREGSILSGSIAGVRFFANLPHLIWQLETEGASRAIRIDELLAVFRAQIGRCEPTEWHLQCQAFQGEMEELLLASDMGDRF